MENNKRIFFKMESRLFAIIFIVLGIAVCFTIKDISELKYLSADFYEKNAKGDFYDYDDLTAKLTILKAKSQMTFFKENLSELYFNLDKDNFKKLEDIFKNKEKVDYYRELLSYAPGITRLKERLGESRHSLINEENKISFYRTFMKNASAYALYCAYKGKNEEFVQTIDRMAGVSVVFSWGYNGKPLMIEFLIGLALKNIVQDTVALITNPEISSYSEISGLINIDLSKEQKIELTQILNTLQTGMPTAKEAMQGEQIMGKRFAEFISGKISFGFAVLDLIFNPFTTTEKVIMNYYKEAVDTIENREEYQKVHKKYSSKWNPLVKIVVMNLSSIPQKIAESAEQNKLIIDNLK
jgi:hypothetical protein